MTNSAGRILVTGGDGFIGSHLVEKLLLLGHKVRAFVFYNSFGSWGWLEDRRDQIGQLEVFPGDIRDPHGVEKAVQGCETIFHLAALIAIPFSYQSPDTYIDTNIKGTLNILQAARKHRVKRLMITSTSEVYGTAKYVPIDENHPFQGQSPYSASKIGADRLAESFFRSFETPITIVRPFNTFGPRQSARAVIPTIITQLLDGKTELQLGSVIPTRDFTFVEDTVEGFIKLAKCTNAIGKEVNIATGKELSIGEIAEKIIKKINPKAQVTKDLGRNRPENSEVYRLLGANNLIKQLVNWSPKHTFDEGLDKTITWFKNPQNLNKYKSWLYNI